MKYSKRICLAIAVFISFKSVSQEVPKGFELTEIVKIAETYRLAPNLSFNIHYTYSDSAQPNQVIEQLDGSHKIHNGKFWSMLDSIEFLQGNLYSLGIYHKDSLIIVNNRQDYTSVMQIPMMDSLFRESNVTDMQVTRLDDSTRSIKIQFTPQTQYRGYEMQYDINSFLIRKVKYYIPDPGDEDNPPVSSGVVCITINFLNYSEAPINEEYFNESKFIYRQGNELLSQPAFTGYRIIANIQDQNK